MHILKFPKVYIYSWHVNQSALIPKIYTSTWCEVLKVVIEYAYFEIPKGIYMFLTCQSKHMNFEYRFWSNWFVLINVVYSVCIFKKRYDEIQLGIYIFLTCQSKHMNLKIFWTIWFVRLNVVIQYEYCKYDMMKFPKVFIFSRHVHQSTRNF